jgi:hypothetical protein
VAIMATSASILSSTIVLGMLHAEYWPRIYKLGLGRCRQEVLVVSQCWNDTKTKKNCRGSGQT